jgi:hypothetical protein
MQLLDLICLGFSCICKDDDKNVDVDLLGLIAVPYDDGQYSVHTNYAKAWNLIGFDTNGAYQYCFMNQITFKSICILQISF